MKKDKSMDETLFGKAYYKLRQGVITNCGSSLYYKLRQGIITNCDRYTLLQIATSFITNCNRYYKLRQPLFQIATGITNCDVITNCDSTLPFRLPDNCMTPRSLFPL